MSKLIRNANGSAKWVSITSCWQEDYYYYFATDSSEPYAVKKPQHMCCLVSCMSVASVGAHIIFVDKAAHGAGVFIAPMCNSHNSQKAKLGDVPLRSSTDLMPSNKSSIKTRVMNRKKGIMAKYKPMQKAMKNLGPRDKRKP